MTYVPSLVWELTPDPIWGDGPAVGVIFIVSLLVHAICLCFFLRYSTLKPSLLLVLGWALTASACSGFSVWFVAIALPPKFNQTGTHVTYQSVALFALVLIGIPLACWLGHRRQNASGRKTLWLQSVLHIPILILVVVFLFVRTLHPSDLFLFDLWSVFGFPILVVIANLLALALSRNRHRRLLLAAHPHLCPACGYNLTGSPQIPKASCPECGAPFPPYLLAPQPTPTKTHSPPPSPPPQNPTV